jgi:hypothetical protein
VASFFIIEEYAKQETSVRAGGRQGYRLCRKQEAADYPVLVLLVRPIVSDSHWVLAVHHVFHFLPASYNIRNVGKPTAPCHVFHAGF